MTIRVPYWVSQAVGETGKRWCTQIRPHYGVGAAGWMSDLNGRAQPITVYIHVSKYQNETAPEPTKPLANGTYVRWDGWYVDVEASNVGNGRYCECYLEFVGGSNSQIHEGTLGAHGDGNGYVSRRRLGRVMCQDSSVESGGSDYRYRGDMTFRIRVRSADGLDYYSGNYYVAAG
ncbi:MAG: hypothetical protein ACRDBJ_11555 [Plesiomonas shigelloides]